MSGESLRVADGSVQVLRLYDVANAIDLKRVEALAAGPAGTAPARARLERTESKAMTFGVAPVAMSLGQDTVQLGDGTARCDLTARAYDFGVVTVAARFPVRDVAWAELVSFSTALDRTLEGDAGGFWTRHRERLLEAIGPAVERLSTPMLEEDYRLTAVRALQPPIGAEELLARADIATLLTGDVRPLSESMRRDVLRHTFSYYPDDLVALAWDHAFVYDPMGESDVADVLEVANAQLLELRYYDDVLDEELPRMYEQVASTRGSLPSLSSRRYSRLARTIYTRVAEVTEITERVDDALIVTEDVYLARIYGAALELFRVPSWRGGVERKLRIMRDSYSALYEEAATARAELLELAIVLLIVFEIVLFFTLGD